MQVKLKTNGDLFVGFLLHQKWWDSIQTKVPVILSELKSKRKDYFNSHDMFYSSEIAQGGLTLENALVELLSQKFTKNDPNETTLQYVNALRLLCEEFAECLAQLERPECSYIRQYAPQLDQWLSSLQSCGGILPTAANSPMIIPVPEIEDGILRLSTINSTALPEILDTLLKGFLDWLSLAKESNSLILIYLINKLQPFYTPESRIISSLGTNE